MVEYPDQKILAPEIQVSRSNKAVSPEQITKVSDPAEKTLETGLTVKLSVGQLAIVFPQASVTVGGGTANEVELSHTVGQLGIVSVTFWTKATLLHPTAVPSSSIALIDITQGNEGCLYVVDGGYTLTGRIRRICPTEMGIDENGKVGFSVHPNPNNGTFRLNLSEEMNGGELNITTVSGRHIFSQTLNSLSTTIDLDKMEKGIYTDVTFKIVQPSFII